MKTKNIIIAFSFVTYIPLYSCLKINANLFMFPKEILKLRTSIDLNQKLVLLYNYEAQSEQLQGSKLFNRIPKLVNVRGYVRC